MKKIKNFLIRLFSKKPTRHKQLPVPVHAEPKPQNRFVVYLDGIPSYFVQSCDAPSAFVNNDGETEFEPINITFIDLLSPSSSVLLYNFIKNFKNPNIIYLKILSPCGETTEKWRLINCKIISYSFGNFSYNSNHTNKLHLTILPEDCILSQEELFITEKTVSQEEKNVPEFETVSETEEADVLN
jgi:hypothetical protein